MDKQVNRRKAVRFSHGNLFVMVKRRGFMGRIQKPSIVNWMNFNQYGMSFVSDGKFNSSKELLIDITIDDTKEKELLTEITGIIKNESKEPTGNYRYGIEFDFDANDYMRSEKVKNTLHKIEQVLQNIFYQIEVKKKIAESN